MSYIVPTVADFNIRFGARFPGVANATIQSALDEAALYVDDTWVSQANFTFGRLLYAAHVLTLDGFGTGAEAQAAMGGTLGLKSMSSGTFSITRSDDASAGGAKASLFSSTSYGRRFLSLMRANNPAVLVV